MVGIQADLLGIIGSEQPCPASILMPMFQQLPPVTVDFMLGTWRGGKFDGGAEPDPVHWFGKRFISRDYAEPLLCRSADGRVYSCTKLGGARLREAAIFGTTSASLIYDQQPIVDYFRMVTEQLVIGLADIKGRPLDFFFHLRRT